MKNVSGILIITALSSLLVISCKLHKKTTAPVVVATPPPPPPPVKLSYVSNVKFILDQKCATCHDGPSRKGDFTNFAGVIEKVNSGAFKQRVFVQKDMPPYGGGDPLSNTELNILKEWLEKGAPE